MNFFVYDDLKQGMKFNSFLFSNGCVKIKNIKLKKFELFLVDEIYPIMIYSGTENDKVSGEVWTTFKGESLLKKIDEFKYPCVRIKRDNLFYWVMNKADAFAKFKNLKKISGNWKGEN